MKRMIVWVLMLIPTLVHAQQGELQPVEERLSFDAPVFGEKVLSRWKIFVFASEEVSYGSTFGDPAYFGGLKISDMIGDFGIVDIRYYPGRGNKFLSMGWHVGTSRLSAKGTGQRFFQQGNRIILTPYPDLATEIGESTTFWRFRYSIPFQYSYIFGRNASWRASAGCEVHWNLINQTNSHWTVDGNHVRELIENMHPNPVSLDLMASLSYSGLGLRFRYSPIPVFKPENGPAYQTWNVGMLVEF